MHKSRAIDEQQISTRPPLWLAATILVHGLLVLLYVVLWYNFIFVQDDMWRADFSAFYTGWTIVLDGQGANLYDFDLQAQTQQAILEGRSFAGGLLQFVNPPFVAVLLAPLALLPLDTAFVVWSVLQLAMLGGVLLLLRHMARDWHPYERWLLLSAVVAFPPLFDTLLLGTFSLWMTLCIVLIYVLLRKRHDASAGGVLLLGMVKPQMMVLPGCALLGGRNWRALAATLLASSGVFVLTSLVLGWHIWLDYLRILHEASALFETLGIHPGLMYNVKGTLTLLLGPEQAPWINTLSSILLGGMILVTLWLWRRPWNPAAPDFGPRFALTITLGLLFSPHLYSHDAFALVLPAALCYDSLRHDQARVRHTYAAFVLACPLLFLSSELFIDSALRIRVPVVAMLALTGWAVVAMQRATTGSRGSAI